MFSGAIKILDLNDYIKPEDECVVIIKDKKVVLPKNDLSNPFDDEPKVSLIKKNQANAGKITLTDCLACSGCITSSETLLIEEQSVKNFLAQYLNFKKRFMIISPQSLSSIAYKLKISEHQFLSKFNSFMKQKFDFDFVLEISTFIEISNELAFREFIKKDHKKVIFSSECPGWVCYAEKVLGDKFLEMISKVKTPQLIASEIIKNLLIDENIVILLEIRRSLWNTCRSLF